MTKFLNRLLFLSSSFLLLACGEKSQNMSSLIEPVINMVGAMHQVMMKGQLQGTVRLDTIRNKTYLYGLGPMAFLEGEITVMDGKSYRSVVLSDSTLQVEESFNVQAPFFVYANVPFWSELVLPDSIKTMNQIEEYLDFITAEKKEPFALRLIGTVESAHIHVVKLPAGTAVKSQADAHLGQMNYVIEQQEVEVIGFYSRNHKGIFTHHDSNLHMHLITADRKKMGHLDDITFQGIARIFLPQTPSFSCLRK